MSEYDDNRDYEEWTPAIGWRKAITRLILRSFGGALIQAGALLVVLLVLYKLNVMFPRLALLMGGVAGFAHGWLVSEGIVDKTGIATASLRVAVAVSIVAVAAVLFFACYAMELSLPLACGCIVVACVTAVITSMFRIAME
jgi:hypothetical protein